MILKTSVGRMMMFVFEECDSTLNKIYSRLTTNGLDFARTALSKTNRNS